MTSKSTPTSNNNNNNNNDIGSDESKLEPSATIDSSSSSSSTITAAQRLEEPSTGILNGDISDKQPTEPTGGAAAELTRTPAESEPSLSQDSLGSSTESAVQQQHLFPGLIQSQQESGLPLVNSGGAASGETASAERSASGGAPIGESASSAGADATGSRCSANLVDSPVDQLTDVGAGSVVDTRPTSTAAPVAASASASAASPVLGADQQQQQPQHVSACPEGEGFSLAGDSNNNSALTIKQEPIEQTDPSRTAANAAAPQELALLVPSSATQPESVHASFTAGASTAEQQHDPVGSQLAAGALPEYTILTPVTPMRSNQTSEQVAMQQQQQPQVAITPTATILTDLDATSAHHHNQQQQQMQQQQQQHHDNNNQKPIARPANPPDSTNQDGSQQQAHYHTINSSSAQDDPTNQLTLSSLSAGIKIEPSEPSANSAGAPSHGPLTELTPAAVGTTLSELTTVSIHNQDNSSNQQYPSLVAGTGQQQQQQQQQQQLSNVAGTSELHGSGEQAGLNLMSGHLQQSDGSLVGQQQQQMSNQRRPQSATSGDLLASSSALSTVTASNASTSSACSSSSNAGTSSTGGAGATGATNASTTSSAGTGAGGTTAGGGKRRTWNQVNRNLNKTEIQKVYSRYGFRCYLETPISTCRRKEEDRITYINKGEFYGLSLEYIPDPQKPLRSAIVKTVVMLVFREDKPPEEDLKSWQFWHSRQHSAKQRILDADNKNHTNVINQIEEISLNAIAFYWNPIETRSAKLNVAVQCLSTDFSNQKGVKGLPLNLQVDIYDLFTETSTPVFRGYATLLSYCDKGAQRRSRDEERRALKRKLTDAGSVSSLASGGSVNKKFDDLYHKPCDRSEFYSMADLIRPPTLYTPSEQDLLDGPKQPMSQSSGVSITPISATTPIPSMDSLSQYSQQQAQQQVVVPVPSQVQHPQSGPQLSATVIQTSVPQASRPAPHSAAYNIIPSPAEYMSHAPQPLGITSIGGPAQAVLAGSQQQSPHSAMVNMGGSQQQQHLSQQAQQQQQLSQHQVMSQQQQQQQQQQHQQQHQQQQHHYHAMGGSLQPSYGLIQTDHHQPQQYAILQAPAALPMVQAHHHHQQASLGQQQMVATSTSGQQLASPMDSRGQSLGSQHQQQQPVPAPIMMGQSGMMSQSSQQQQQQQQHMQHMQQYQSPIIGLTTTNSIPIGQTAFNKRVKLYPDPSERVLIYAKQKDENDFYPLHLSPPSLNGLIYAIEQKYKIDSAKVANIYKKSKKGIRVLMDDDMIRHYCNEETVQLEVHQAPDSLIEITLVEL